ncbi:MAG TPA: (2Fe-2S)-binding protein [Sinorhizobium sp.]|nr:(2Fe-2S)-binding protein [Sinorhizobium sp.]
MPAPITIQLTVNGTERRGSADPRKLLVDFLREDLGLTGTHVGCEHGICGACTVLLNGEAVRSCLMFAVQAEGAEIRTVEDLSQGNQLHPLQQAFRDNYGLQCGFCTPGFLMTACDLLRNGDDLSEEQIRVALSGNLCRCTGYQSIVESIQAAIVKMRET